jgi:hypothetical protein
MERLLHTPRAARRPNGALLRGDRLKMSGPTSTVPGRSAPRMIRLRTGVIASAISLFVGVAIGVAPQTPTPGSALPSASASTAPTPSAGVQTVEPTLAPSAESTLAPTATATVTPSAVTLLDLKGRGIKNSKTFATTSMWTLHYTFDCTGFGSKGIFQVYLFEGPDLVGILVNELARKGASSTPVYDTGNLHLQMNSTCSWHVKVTQP